MVTKPTNSPPTLSPALKKFANDSNAAVNRIIIQPALFTSTVLSPSLSIRNPTANHPSVQENQSSSIPTAIPVSGDSPTVLDQYLNSFIGPSLQYQNAVPSPTLSNGNPFADHPSFQKNQSSSIPSSAPVSGDALDQYFNSFLGPSLQYQNAINAITLGHQKPSSSNIPSSVPTLTPSSNPSEETTYIPTESTLKRKDMKNGDNDTSAKYRSANACKSDAKGSVGITTNAYSKQINIPYEVELENQSSRDTMVFMIETIPIVEKLFVDYLGQIFFTNSCQTSLLQSVIGFMTFAKNEMSATTQCDKNETISSNESDTCFLSLQGILTIYYNNSDDNTAIDEQRIQGVLLGIVGWTFEESNCGVKKISVLPSNYIIMTDEKIADEFQNATLDMSNDEESSVPSENEGYNINIRIVLITTISGILLMFLIMIWYVRRKKCKLKHEMQQLSTNFFDLTCNSDKDSNESKSLKLTEL